MKRNKRRPETQKALMRRITALVLGLWLLTMGLITYATAKDFLFQIYHQAESYVRAGYGIRSSEYDPKLPGMTETGLIRTTGFHNMHLRTSKLFPFAQPHTPSTINSNDWIFGKWDLMYGYEAAVLYYDKEEDFYLGSGDYITFTYTSEENWKSLNPEAQGFAYIDMDAAEGCLESLEKVISGWPDGDPHLDMLTNLMRLKGYFEGNRFVPVSVDTGHYYAIYPDAEIDRTPKNYSIVDARGSVEWNNVFTAEVMPERELVTVYSWDFFGILADYEPVTVDGVFFEGLPELLNAQVNGDGSFTRENLWDAVFVHYGHCDFRVNGEFMNDYTFAIAVRCWPMGYAAWRLIPCYLVSLVVAVFLILLFRRRIRRSLTIPLENAISGIEQWIRPDPWREPKIVTEKLQKYKDDLHAAETVNQQLQTALDYAENAEKNRRQLVSNITHELKTPLAIIHSYAEGLQSDIPAEKKEKYLSVILEESERMDAMVLQMLDLSRLEAGKVRFSTDSVSLLRLTEAVMEKFAPAIEAKGLTVSYEMAKDFTFTADEARLTQAITNLVSNAVKYTEPGGRIRLWIYEGTNNARFEIANTAPPLSSEAKEKVFDSFYRADPSRSEPGTGLGLAIVKSIAELHRGSCSVRNVTYQEESFVEFVLNLPLN